MHLVAKTVNGSEYFYLVEKARRDGRVVTARTIYIGNRAKLVELIDRSGASQLPQSFAAQQVGASLALAVIANDLGLESVIDAVVPVRAGAVPNGRRLVVAAIHRVLAGRTNNGTNHLREFYAGSVLNELLPLPLGSLDDRRIGEVMADLTARNVEQIEAAVVQRLVQREGIRLEALAFDCTNFDSYVSAKTPSRLLRRGHGKSGKPLRNLGMGLLATADDGIPLLTFVYPGNENDVTAFARFLKSLDRRRQSLPLPIETTVAGDGGNISRQLLLRLERDPRYYVLRLPATHLGVARQRRSELGPLAGTLKGKVWAHKMVTDVYGVERCVVDVYSKRMHLRQLPGLRRDRDRARADLEHLQRQLDKQRAGQRRAKPLTLRRVRERVKIALAREHMADLFQHEVQAGAAAPVMSYNESPEAWTHLEDHVLGRTLLVTNRADWAPEQIVHASRMQSHNERLFRDLKDPDAGTMLPLRHRKDAILRSHALVAVLGLLLVRVMQRRVKRAGLAAPSVASVLKPLKGVTRARLNYGPEAAPALRALAANQWVPAERTARQSLVLTALGIASRPELGTTFGSPLRAKLPRKATDDAA